MFVHAGGTVHELELDKDEKLRVDTGCLVAFEEKVDYNIEFNADLKTALFGGEGLFFVNLTGPGKVFLQSLPFSRLADRLQGMPQTLGRGEGSILGGIGRIWTGTINFKLTKG